MTKTDDEKGIAKILKQHEEQFGSAICHEYKLPYGMCWWCNGQAYPLLRHIQNAKEETIRTELWWACSCGKEWPMRHICAAIASRVWKMEYISENDSPLRCEIWYPRDDSDNPNGSHRFTEEFLREKRAEEGLPKEFGRQRFTYDDWEYSSNKTSVDLVTENKRLQEQLDLAIEFSDQGRDGKGVVKILGPDDRQVSFARVTNLNGTDYAVSRQRPATDGEK